MACCERRMRGMAPLLSCPRLSRTRHCISNFSSSLAGCVKLALPRSSRFLVSLPASSVANCPALGGIALAHPTDPTAW